MLALAPIVKHDKCAVLTVIGHAIVNSSRWTNQDELTLGPQVLTLIYRLSLVPNHGK